IAVAPQSGFRTAPKPSASVTVSAAAGISRAQARALRFLVASAVAGLSPADVSVIDADNGVVAAGDEDMQTGINERELALKRNLERLPEARVGYGKAVVEVTIDALTEREAITERRFDPEGRVLISSETEEQSSTSNDAASGAVTVASNLPDGDAGANSGSRQSADDQTRERVNYEVSETTREILREPGAIRRLTVAVLVDGTRQQGADRSEEHTSELQS